MVQEQFDRVFGKRFGLSRRSLTRRGNQKAGGGLKMDLSTQPCVKWLQMQAIPGSGLATDGQKGEQQGHHSSSMPPPSTTHLTAHRRRWTANRH